MSKIFFDTNILLYANDSSSKKKQLKVQQVLLASANKHRGVISTQVLQEYYVTETKKFKRDPLLVKDMLKVWQQFEVITINPELIEEAVDISLLYKFSFWDSLIIAAALFAHCTELFTEDLHTGQVIRGLEIVNPFK